MKEFFLDRFTLNPGNLKPSAAANGSSFLPIKHRRCNDESQCNVSILHRYSSDTLTPNPTGWCIVSHRDCLIATTLSLRVRANKFASSKPGMPCRPPYSRQDSEATATENFTDAGRSYPRLTAMLKAA